MSLATVQRKLAEGLASWLTYEFHCMRGDLFSEKALALPIGNILAASFKERISAEYVHPILKDDHRRGRRPQLDYVVEKDGKIVCAVESKWTTTSTIAWRDIMWDLIRLEMMSYQFECSCLMVLAGFGKNIDKLVPGTLTANHTKVLFGRTKLLPSKVDLRVSTHLDEYEEELTRYSKVRFPTCVVVQNPHVYPKSGNNMSFKVLVWKVRSQKTADRFQRDYT